MGVHSAMIKGTCSVTVVDCHSDRLKLAESIGAIAIDYSTEDPVQPVMDLTYGMGGARVANASAQCQTNRPNLHSSAGLRLLKTLMKAMKAG